MDQLARDGGPKVRKKPWPAAPKRFGREELKQLREALDQNTLFYMHGEKTKSLCARMATLVGAKHVVACSSGSAALHGAIKACGVGPGDEVVTSPITDAGTILGIIYEGAVPVFADVDPLTYNATAATIEPRISSRTRAVIAIHLAGSPADVKPIARLCRKRGLRLIEDCAQAWGARVDGQWVGTFGDLGCFSLNDFKHISAGDGGLVVTNDEALYRTAWLAIDKCYDRISGGRQMEFVAPNYRITELQSAVALAQLEKVERIAADRNALGDRLTKGLRNIRGVRPHGVVKGGFATWVRAPAEAAISSYVGSAGPCTTHPTLSAGCGLCSDGTNHEAFCDCKAQGGIHYALCSPGDAPGIFHMHPQSFKMKDIFDGTSNTLLVGEWHSTDGDKGGCGNHMQWLATWASASTVYGINFPNVTNYYNGCNFRSRHPGGAQFGLCDGSVRFLSETINLRLFGYLGSKAGGDVVGDF